MREYVLFDAHLTRKNKFFVNEIGFDVHMGTLVLPDKQSHLITMTYLFKGDEALRVAAKKVQQA